MADNLDQKIWKHILKAQDNWNLWSDKDKLLIGLSGGKDSLALAKILSDKNLNIQGIFIDTGFTDSQEFIDYCKTLMPVEVIKAKNEIKAYDKNACFSCSRGRKRQILEFAQSKQIKKIIYAHHKQDVVETLLLNQLFSREFSTMVAKQQLFRGQFEVLRPLYFCPEELISKYSYHYSQPISKNNCPMEKKSKRQYIKLLLNKLEQDNPNTTIVDNIFSSAFHIKADFLP